MSNTLASNNMLSMKKSMKWFNQIYNQLQFRMMRTLESTRNPASYATTIVRDTAKNANTNMAVTSAPTQNDFSS